MKRIWTRIKQFAAVAWIPLAAVGVLAVGCIAWLIFSRKHPLVGQGWAGEVVSNARERLAIANTTAALEIAAARHEDAAVAAELASIAKDLDTKRRLARLVSLRERLP